MIIQLHDNWKHLDFAPISLTRPIGNIRVGILTNDERWKILLPEAEITFETQDYLADKFPQSSKAITVNACIIPTMEIAQAVAKLKGNEKLSATGVWIASSGTGEIMVNYTGELPTILNHRWELFQKNGEILAQDFKLLTKGRKSAKLSATNTVIGDQSLIFLEEGAVVEAAILNTNEGPIYIGKNAEIMEGAVVRGALALCEGATLKLGAKVYGPTTLGPFCKVGGEVNNVIFQAFSNKGHDGFLGNSVIGEWCNIGADTNTSNLKNNYGLVKTYSYASQKLEQTDFQFMGLFMGDHSACGINTMFNTGSVVGVSSNIFGAGFPPKFIPSFTWGMGSDVYDFDKAMDSANNRMKRRNKALSAAEIALLKFIADKK